MFKGVKKGSKYLFAIVFVLCRLNFCLDNIDSSQQSVKRRTKSFAQKNENKSASTDENSEKSAKHSLNSRNSAFSECSLLTDPLLQEYADEYEKSLNDHALCYPESNTKPEMKIRDTSEKSSDPQKNLSSPLKQEFEKQKGSDSCENPVDPNPRNSRRDPTQSTCDKNNSDSAYTLFDTEPSNDDDDVFATLFDEFFTNKYNQNSGQSKHQPTQNTGQIDSESVQDDGLHNLDEKISRTSPQSSGSKKDDLRQHLPIREVSSEKNTFSGHKPSMIGQSTTRNPINIKNMMSEASQRKQNSVKSIYSRQQPPKDGSADRKSSETNTFTKGEDGPFAYQKSREIVKTDMQDLQPCSQSESVENLDEDELEKYYFYFRIHKRNKEYRAILAQFIRNESQRDDKRDRTPDIEDFGVQMQVLAKE